MPRKKRIINLPLSNIKTERDAVESLNESQMQIYDQIAMAAMQGKRAQFSAALKSLEAIPSEERYVTRIISALDVAFGDFDTASINLDRDTLPLHEFDRMAGILEARVVRFSILMRAFFGLEEMKKHAVVCHRSGIEGWGRSLELTLPCNLK